MTRNLTLLTSALFMLLPMGAAFAADDLAGCNSMLETAVGYELQAEGIDTANACDLTLTQLAQIKSLLDQDGMGSRAQIELILSEAGGK